MKAKLAAGVTVLLWASAFPAISVAVRGLGPAGLAVGRLVVASAALALVAPVLGVRRPRARDLPLIALCGLAGMTGYQLLLNTGERVVPAGTASLLVATAPVYASLLAVAFLSERPGRRWWAGSAVALAGTAVIAAAHGLSFGTSALVVLAAAVLQGIFHTAQKPLLARYTGFEVTAYAMWAGMVFILPWAGSLFRTLPHAGGGAIGAATFLGVAPSALGFVAWAYAMARMDVGRVTTSLYLVPAAAIVISLVWLGQVPGPVELGGGAVALAGVALAGSRRRVRRGQRSAGPDPRDEGGQVLRGSAPQDVIRHAQPLSPLEDLGGDLVQGADQDLGRGPDLLRSQVRVNPGQPLGGGPGVVGHDDLRPGAHLEAVGPFAGVPAQPGQEGLGGGRLGQHQLARRQFDLRHRRHRRDDESVGLGCGQP
jgi:drug/metabolite transporter (DMT)-like permease